jgi:opacity protein-like surface antigen
MMKKTVQSLMALAVLLSSAGAAQARDLIKDIQLDVFVLGGASTLVDAQYWDSADRVYHSRFEVGPKYTLGVAVPYGKLLTIETAFSYGPNNWVVTNTNVFPHVGQPYPVRDYSGSISAVGHAPFSFFHLRPYAEGGVEYDRFSPTSAAISTALNPGFAADSTAIITHNDKLGLNVGIGLDRKLTKRLTFRLDLRDHITSSPAFGLPPKPTSDSLGAFYPVSGRANNLEYTAGFVLHLGKL